MERKKIAFITSSPRTVLAFLQNHIKCFASHYDVYVFSNLKGSKEKENLIISTDENEYNSIEKFASIVHVGITRRISIVNDIKTIFTLSRTFKKVKFSAVHSVTSKAGIIVMVSGFFAGVKHRFHTYTGQVWATKKGISHFFFRFMDKIIAVLCTYCYADSRSQMDFLLNKKVVTKGKISVLGEGSISGVDTTRFFPDIVVRNKIRKSLSITNDEILFLLLCRLTRDKGALDLAQAFSRLVKETNCSLLVVGPDEENLTDEILRIIGDDYKSKIKFHGFTKCHEQFLNASDILCLPSYREGFGSIIIDAAAVGIPAIGSDIYGIRDAIVDEETGILHKAGDTADIYKAMHRLANNHLLRENMGKKALLRVKNKFTMEKITTAWLNEYKRKMQNNY